jgi:tetratricopeptide (TPR) repeat protein
VFPKIGEQAFRVSNRVAIRTTAILLCLTAVRLSLASEPQTELDEWTITHFQQAREAQNSSQFERAVEEYRLVVSRRPEFAEAWLNLGIAYQQQSDYVEAAKAFRTALAQKPGMVQAQVLLGMSLCLTQDYRAALKPLDDALAQNPKERQAGIYRALAMSGLEQPEVAAQQLRRSLGYYPNDPELLYQLGEAYNDGMRQSGELVYKSSRNSALYEWAMALSSEAKGADHAAIQRYLAALQIDPFIPEIYARLVVLLRAVGVADLSRELEQRFRQLKPPKPFLDQIEQEQTPAAQASATTVDDRKSYRSSWEKVPRATVPADLPLLADSAVNEVLKNQVAGEHAQTVRTAVRFFKVGDMLGAIAALRTIRGRSTPNWLAPYLLARCHLLQGDADAAESVLEAAPLSARQVPSVALLKLEIQSELAGRSYAALVQMHPDSYRARMLKARTLGAKNHVDDAVREYRAVLEARPGLPQVHLAIAQLYVDELNWPNAIEELNQELAVSPNNSLAMALLGRAYVQTGNETLAIPLLRKVIARYPNDAYALGDLGKALAATGQTKEAIDKLEAALSCDPSLYRLRYRLSELYRQTGHPDLARKQLVAFQTESARRKTQLPALE